MTPDVMKLATDVIRKATATPESRFCQIEGRRNSNTVCTGVGVESAAVEAVV